MKKVLFASSAGGHLAELMQLSDMFKEYKFSILTEKTDTTLNLKKIYGSKVYYVLHSSRKPLIKFLIKLLINTIKSIFILLKVKPNVIITTGANSIVPICYIAKIFGCKIIYIESFARVKSISLSGKFLKKIADLFLVQHEELLNIYEDVVYEGSLF